VASPWDHFGRKFNWFGPKNEAKRKAHALETQDVT